MRNIWTITKRELVAYFTSPVAYVFLVIFLLLTGFFTFTAGNFFERGEASLAAFFGWHPWLYLVLVPAVGMRVWAEERRSGTMELLLTMPVATWQAIVANRRGRAKAFLRVARIEQVAARRIVTPHTRIAIGLKLLAHGQGARVFVG